MIKYLYKQKKEEKEENKKDVNLILKYAKRNPR
jgi:hypothetical protein